jgi:hypothetical protein
VIERSRERGKGVTVRFEVRVGVRIFGLVPKPNSNSTPNLRLTAVQARRVVGLYIPLPLTLTPTLTLTVK